MSGLPFGWTPEYAAQVTHEHTKVIASLKSEVAALREQIARITKENTAPAPKPKQTKVAGPRSPRKQ